ncbi:type II toxin-antitoxin system VapC family toxin [Brevundimonas sp. PAMC22021]|uniref:type II toxin-antitoxin system VapC family toxin n=1 Tax=Brevundimonas sp. PAMC22021 TaxID=2861285 RepID=UPI001C62B888|nr:type II toxin-antitoxin system VapC family toxin [Brevundimonas sp. PAMC22021]QYF85714.1 type II toxin-antitoxin system VapC family toxin [Brevundimonas sp. PAMC22021]
MKLLIDTHLLLWAAGEPARVPSRAQDLINDPRNTPMFSVVSLMEVSIKAARSRPDFQVDARRLRSMLLAAGYEEVPVLGDHAVAVGPLEPIHKDPFDRLLLAQAIAERATLLTSDAILARYEGPILKV